MPADMQALKNRFLMLSHIGTGRLIVGIVSHSVAYQPHWDTYSLY